MDWNDWQEQTFGVCPHGGAKPYCPQRAGDDVDRKREERLAKRAAEREAQARYPHGED